MPHVSATTETEKSGTATKKAEGITFPLPSGATGEILPGYGRHLEAAQAMVSEPDMAQLALIALLGKVDGRSLTVEDVEAMPLADVVTFQDKITGPAAGEVPADARAHDGGKLIPLPSGSWAEVKKGTGKDLIKAQRQAAGKPAQVNTALVAVLCRRDGRPLVMEDVHGLPLMDVLAMQGAALGN